MIAVIAIMAFAVYLAFFFPLEVKEKKEETPSPKYTAQMKKLWAIAQTAMKERKPFRAEKALLTILKFDEKNAAAYNRLGILYAKDKKFDEAIECFEIAESLDNNASSLHNVGLIYLETGSYEKAVMALKRAIELEGDVAARYIALAKAEEKLGNKKSALENLEQAYELDHSTATLRQILAIHENAGDAEKMAELTARIERQIAEDARIREEKQREKRRAARHRSPVRMVSRVAARSVKGSGAAARGTSSGAVARKAAGSSASAAAARPAGVAANSARGASAGSARGGVARRSALARSGVRSSVKIAGARRESPAGVVKKRRRVRKVQ